MYVVGIPAHTSHVLQPLDVTIFGPFKSFLEREISARATWKLVLDAFDVADVLRFALSEALTASNISSGFKKCGVWDPTLRNATIEPLESLHYFKESHVQDHDEVPALQF